MVAVDKLAGIDRFLLEIIPIDFGQFDVRTAGCYFALNSNISAAPNPAIGMHITDDLPGRFFVKLNFFISHQHVWPVASLCLQSGPNFKPLTVVGSHHPEGVAGNAIHRIFPLIEAIRQLSNGHAVRILNPILKYIRRQTGFGHITGALLRFIALLGANSIIDVNSHCQSDTSQRRDQNQRSHQNPAVLCTISNIRGHDGATPAG